jgi:arsenate reductase
VTNWLLRIRQFVDSYIRQFDELRLGERQLTDAEIIDLMVQHPDLIQRPIVEKGARAILARPAERLREIL